MGQRRTPTPARNPWTQPGHVCSRSGGDVENPDSTETTYRPESRTGNKTAHSTCACTHQWPDAAQCQHQPHHGAYQPSPSAAPPTTTFQSSTTPWLQTPHASQQSSHESQTHQAT